MPTLYLSTENTDRLIAQAVSSLLDGGIIAYPTETLYGLGAKYNNEQALIRLYELKRRPHEKTIPIIIGGCGTFISSGKFSKRDGCRSDTELLAWSADARLRCPKRPEQLYYLCR